MPILITYNRLKKTLQLVVLFLCVANCKAQSYLEFVENKGQWFHNIDFTASLNQGAIALKKDGGYRLLVHNTQDLDAIHNFYHATGKVNRPLDKTASKPIENQYNNTPPKLRSHCFEVSFLNANKTPELIKEKPIDSYNNYFIGNDSSKWARGCKIYQTITYKNIYPNIDIRYYTGNGAIKYDFIVHPHANANDIVLYFDGADKVFTKNKQLVVATSVGNQIEAKPFTYQPLADGNKTIKCNWKVEGKIVTFDIGNYNNDAVLVIDPFRVFATFSGSNADNWGFTATYDEKGSLYGGGIVFSAGFPASNGSSYLGGAVEGDISSYDIGIIKFNPAGTQRMFATYLGGSNANEQPHSLIVNKNFELIIAGRTFSNDYPTTLPTVGIGGGWDILLTTLDNTGGIVASRKFGGSNDDGVNLKPKYINRGQGTQFLDRMYGDDAKSEVILDDNQNVLLASCTQSLDFPTVNAFQTSNRSNPSVARKQDAVFLKTSPDLSSVIVSSYFGGESDDAANVLAINPKNKNIYLAGGTCSKDLLGDTSNSLGKTFFGGVCDGFVVVLNDTGNVMQQMTYIGTNDADVIYGIQFDSRGFPYIMGTTRGIWQVINAQFSQTGGKQFVAKLQPNLSSYVYSTNFGTNNPSPNIAPTAFLVDRCQNVYVSGWGKGALPGDNDDNYLCGTTTGLTVTADAIQPNTNGDNFYFIVIERNAKSILYGSFFGQLNGRTFDHVDGGTSRFDRNGVIYQAICGNCDGPATVNNQKVFPTTSGAYSEYNKSLNPQGNGRCNLAATKISMDLSGIGAGVRSSIKGINNKVTGCVPVNVKFEDTLAQGNEYYWNFGDGTPTVKTTSSIINHVFVTVGYKDVILVSVDSSKCNIFDTSRVTINISPDSAFLRFKYSKVGDCFSTTYNFDNTQSIAPAHKPFKNNSFRIDFGDNTSQIMGQTIVSHTYSSPGTYKVKMYLTDTNYCNTPDVDSITFTIIANVKASFIKPASGCISDTAFFKNTSLGGQSFLWNFGDNTTSTDYNPKHLYSTTGRFTINLFVFDTFSCNKRDTATESILLAGSPTAKFTYSPNPTLVNLPINFINQSIGGAKYVWNFGDGDFYPTNNVNEVVSHLYNEAKSFKVCLKTTNIYDCIDTVCKQVVAKVQPYFDVPSAFTPNGIGFNNKIYCNGYSIKKFDWKIYDRWGILVYQSTNIKNGWDGFYNGVLQPQEVYHYIANVQFYDGSTTSKTGDITLLR
jgi:gliding motility-associated-like protein